MASMLVKTGILVGLLGSLTLGGCGGSARPAKQGPSAAPAEEPAAPAAPKGEPPAAAPSNEPVEPAASSDEGNAPSQGEAADPDDEANPRVQAARAMLEQEELGGLKPGMTGKAVIAVLGKPSSKSKPEVEGATGDVIATWEWKKAAVRAVVADAKKKPIVRNLQLGSGARLKTKKGVGIGSTLAELDAAYAAVRRPSDDGENRSYLVGTLYDGMVFELADGKVTSVYWGVLAE